MSITLADVADFIRDRDNIMLADAVGNDDRILSLLASQTESYSGGTGPQWAIAYGSNSSVGSYAEGAAMPASGDYAELAMALDWSYSHATWRISGRALKAANGDWDRIGGLLSRTVNRATDDLKNDVNTQLIGAGSGNDLQGIAAVVSASGSYGGKSRSTYTFLQSSVTTGVGTLALSAIDTALVALATSPRNASPTIALCGYAVWDIVATLIAAEGAGYSGAGVQITASQTEAVMGLTAAAGPVAIYYKGIPFVKVRGYTAQRIDILEWPKFHFDTMGDIEVVNVEEDVDDVTGRVRLISQLWCEEPGNQAALTGITA